MCDSSTCNKCGSSSCSSSISSISDKYDTLINGIKKDNIKLLEIIKKQNKEIIALKRKVDNLKSCDTDTNTDCYLLELDKTIAFKLDELTTKVDNKLTQLSGFAIATRNLISRRSR